MLTFKLKDREGAVLSLGDIVEISDGRDIKFFARVQWLPQEKKISPFHTFSFHSIRREAETTEPQPGTFEYLQPEWRQVYDDFDFYTSFG